MFKVQAGIVLAIQKNVHMSVFNRECQDCRIIICCADSDAVECGEVIMPVQDEILGIGTIREQMVIFFHSAQTSREYSIMQNAFVPYMHFSSHIYVSAY